ncbi:hypothetical protein T01_10025 [Trichinella spiralis]|uniref:Uncharacterized protein n=1 Tax=Trichinella spiralis TaxID=6334 RepID=A0A0V1C069_TRISP|nr:hypothetical protein T01_10025 [Trichinella spiralis]
MHLLKHQLQFHVRYMVHLQSVDGSMVESLPPTQGTRVRFPVGAGPFSILNIVDVLQIVNVYILILTILRHRKIKFAYSYLFILIRHDNFI